MSCYIEGCDMEGVWPVAPLGPHVMLCGVCKKAYQMGRDVEQEEA